MITNDGVTIAIPNWNHELLLPRAILSGLRSVQLLRQQGTPAEVLVVDDGSRDGSATLLRQLEARYHRDGFRLIACADNAGLVATRNEAVRAGRYRYIAFVDADNEVIPENLPSFLDTLRHTGAAAAYGTLLVRAVAATAGHFVVSNESIQDKWFDWNYVDALAVFDRWQLLDVGGYDRAVPTWEDYALWLHLATNGRLLVFVPMVFGYYYYLPRSMISETADDENTRHLRGRVNRIYNQVGVRNRLPMNTRMRRYHPALGYL